MDQTSTAGFAVRARPARLTISGRLGSRLALHAGTAAAAAVALALVPDAPAVTSARDADLVRLLRAMVLIKAVMALIALGVLDWRLRRPTPTRLVVGYVSLAWLAAATLGALWHLSALGAGALALHGAAVALVAVAYCDRDFIPHPGAR